MYALQLPGMENYGAAHNLPLLSHSICCESSHICMCIWIAFSLGWCGGVENSVRASRTVAHFDATLTFEETMLK